MKKKDLTEAAERLRKMFPDVYTSVSFTVECDMHPGSAPRYSQGCGIYTTELGHFLGTTFEECFAQL